MEIKILQQKDVVMSVIIRKTTSAFYEIVMKI